VKVLSAIVMAEAWDVKVLFLEGTGQGTYCVYLEEQLERHPDSK
jgi:hypothetical protein